MVNAVASGAEEVGEVSAGAALAPAWRRLRFWVSFAAALVLGAVVLAVFSGDAGAASDPTSASKQGSKAVARVLAGYGSPVTRTISVDAAVTAADADATVVVIAPDDYSDVQLERLRAATPRLVLVQPGTRATALLTPATDRNPDATYSHRAGCAVPGARASGDVDWPQDTTVYSSGPAATSCFGGAVVIMPTKDKRSDVVVLGSSSMLQNENLGDDGLAALSVNLLSVDRTASRVVWLLPGSDAEGSGPASIWDLFPAGAYRVFWWLIGLGLLVAVWQSRRLGGVVFEPLPVVVRSAEVVEGHGRLYHRAGARDRAAHALRVAAVRRLAVLIGLPRGSRADDVAVAVAPLVGRTPAEVTSLLAGPVPAGDLDLVHLATQLDRIEAAAGGALSEGN